MSLPGIRKPRVPALPAVPALPGKRFVQVPGLGNTGRLVVGDTDRYGLDREVFGRFPDKSRYYGSIAMKFFGLPLDENPQGGSWGSSATFPEMVVVGMCLEHGYTYGIMDGSKSFVFQQEILGGRMPGGAVIDVMVYQGTERVAVRIESVFHAPSHPFGTGGAKVEQDRRQVARLRAGRVIDRVVDVNRVVDGHPLENGPDFLVERDWERITGRVPTSYQ